jgi:hypothetical protein
MMMSDFEFIGAVTMNFAVTFDITPCICVFVYDLRAWSVVGEVIWPRMLKWLIFDEFGKDVEVVVTYFTVLSRNFSRERQSGYSVSRAMFERGSFGIQVKSLMKLSYWTVAYQGGVGVQSPPEIPRFWQSWAEFPFVVHFVLILL